MITVNVEKWMGQIQNGQSLYYREGVCLSTDDKPVNWANGSKLAEMDTGKLYLYDAANQQWREF